MQFPYRPCSLPVPGLKTEPANSATNNTLSTLTPQNMAPGLQSCQAPWRQSGGARHKAQEAALVSRVQPRQHRQEVAQLGGLLLVYLHRGLM